MWYCHYTSSEEWTRSLPKTSFELKLMAWAHEKHSTMSFKLLNATKAHEGWKLHYNTSLLFCFLYLPLHGLLCNRFATFKHHMGTVHCKEFTEMTIIRKYTENHCMQKGCVHYICTGFSAKSTITCIASLIRFCGSKFPEQPSEYCLFTVSLIGMANRRLLLSHFQTLTFLWPLCQQNAQAQEILYCSKYQM